MSDNVIDDPDKEPLTAWDANSKTLGLRFLAPASACCSILDLGVVVEELFFDAESEPEADFHDFRIDLRTPLFLSGAFVGGCCVTEGGLDFILTEGGLGLGDGTAGKGGDAGRSAGWRGYLDSFSTIGRYGFCSLGSTFGTGKPASATGAGGGGARETDFDLARLLGTWGGGMLGDDRPDSGIVGVPDIDCCFPLFLQSRLILFIPINDDPLLSVF